MAKHLRNEVIPFDKIIVDDGFNCRGTFMPHEVHSTAQSIKAMGLVQLCVVREIGPGRYAIVAGFRRLAAMKQLDWTEHAFAVWEMTDLEAVALNLAENIERQNLNIEQEANAVDRLVKQGMPVPEIERMLKRGPQWVRDREDFHALDRVAKDVVLAGGAPVSEIRNLLKIQVHCGHEHLLKALREYQDAKDEKRKPNVIGRKNYRTMRPRKQTEIESILVLLGKYVPYAASIEQMANLTIDCRPLPLLWYKTLAWTAGKLTTADLLVAAHDFCEALGVKFVYPEDFAEEIYATQADTTVHTNDEESEDGEGISGYGDDGLPRADDSDTVRSW